MDDGFWAGVLVASAVATAFATGISTLAAVWWRRQDRREADWVFFGEYAARQDKEDGYGNGPTLSVDAELANAGDGTAFRVRASGRNACQVRLQGELVSSHATGYSGRADRSVVPAIAPGASVHIRVDCDSPDVWDDAEILITWVRSPTWKKRRSHRQVVIPLCDIAPLPPSS